MWRVFDLIGLYRILLLTGRDQRFLIYCLRLHHPETTIFIYFRRPRQVLAIHPQRGFGHAGLLLNAQTLSDERPRQPAPAEWPAHTNTLSPAAQAMIEVVLLVINKRPHLARHLVCGDIPGNLPQLRLKACLVNQPALVILLAWLHEPPMITESLALCIPDGSVVLRQHRAQLQTFG